MTSFNAMKITEEKYLMNRFWNWFALFNDVCDALCKYTKFVCTECIWQLK